jgi:xylulokinase
MYSLGYDVGSSSIKAALIDLKTNQPVKVVQYPPVEMSIDSPQPGWAEQDPETWWINLIEATRLLLKGIDSKIIDAIKGIGISYQMHGLVLLDADGQVLRPAIIWCDSRAVEAGDQASKEIGENACFEGLLNLPGNFTGSKLKWVKDNEPDVYDQIDKLMLPGDYLNFKLTGEINTTPSGLSEGILWDFKHSQPAEFAFAALGIKPTMIPEVRDTFSLQGEVSKASATELGIPAGVPVAYRAGDQPNNAMSLGVIEAGEIAATGGTSGVVYGVMDKMIVDPKSRINSFAHVNYTSDRPMTGALLCINGAGSLYRWTRQITGDADTTYGEMETAASQIPIGSDGLVILPFGNGVERMLENKDLGAQIHGIDFNRHGKAHMYRASLEGIAFSFVYGTKVLEALGVTVNKMKAGNDNLFQSEIFSSTVATLLGCNIELVETTGAVGAGKAVGFTLGIKSSLAAAMSGNKIDKIIQPDPQKKELMQSAYNHWKEILDQKLNN